jgi:hypothetical protein
MTSEDTPSGLDYLRSIIDGRTPRAPISHTLGFDLVAVEGGSAVFEGRTGAHLCNPAHATATCAVLS